MKNRKTTKSKDQEILKRLIELYEKQEKVKLSYKILKKEGLSNE